MPDRKRELRQQRDLSAGEVFALRLAEVRARRGWTQQQLADRLAEIGHPIGRVTLAKLEHGDARSRGVSLEDVLAISFALGVSPLHMIVPFDPDRRLIVASEKQPVDTILARRWLRGQDTLLDEDPQFFFQEAPWVEIKQLLEIAGSLEAPAGKLLSDVGFSPGIRQPPEE